jgi:hypothetical protein
MRYSFKGRRTTYEKYDTRSDALRDLIDVLTYIENMQILTVTLGAASGNLRRARYNSKKMTKKNV